MVLKKPVVKKAKPVVKRAKPVVKKAVAVKPKVKRAVIRQPEPRLRLFADTDFSGTLREFKGNLGVRNLSRLSFNNTAESLRFNANNNVATLVLFDLANYGGNFIVFRGSTDVADLGNQDFDNITSSFIMSNSFLSDTDIRNIRDSKVIPSNFAEILRIVRRGRAARKARAKK